MTSYVLIVTFILGLAIGSFCNVVIFRLHARESPFRGRSRCPQCKRELAARDLVPLLSYVLLRGCCRYCRKPIAVQYPLVELAMGTLAVVMVLRFGVGAGALFGTVLAAFLLVIFAYDLRYQLILDVVSIPAMVVAIAASLFLHRAFLSIALGGILGALFFALQFAASRGRWVGGGDIRLGAVLGFMLGWPLVVVALVLAYLLGAVVAVGFLIRRKMSWSSMLPFGTFLSVAGVMTYLWGAELLQWYLHGGFLVWFANTFFRY